MFDGQYVCYDAHGRANICMVLVVLWRTEACDEEIKNGSRD